MKKKYIWINTIGIFLLSFLCHFIYDWFPNQITAIFFPVNESIWEHVKMLYTTIILFGIIEYFIYKKNRISLHHFFTTLFCSAFLNLIILLVLYLPIYYLFKEHMITTIVILFLSILLSQIITFPILQKKENKVLNICCLILIPLLFIIFGYLTYHPILCDLFYDPLKEKYGR